MGPQKHIQFLYTDYTAAFENCQYILCIPGTDRKQFVINHKICILIVMKAQNRGEWEKEIDQILLTFRRELRTMIPKKEHRFWWPGCTQVGGRAEQENGVQVPALPAL